MLLSAYLALVTSLVIAAVAGWYSIVGLMVIFSGAAIPVAIMGAVLEIGKLVTASWLYRNWSHSNLLLRLYLTIAVMILMIITSMGIFGFLSKAHLEVTINAQGGTSIQIEAYERQIQTNQNRIDSATKAIAILDGEIETLQKYDRIRGPDGAIAVRNSQKEERDSLNATIAEAETSLMQIQEALLPLRMAQVNQEAEIGPLKYIAELIYGEEATNHFDAAVRWIILLLVSVFDPLAVVLLIAANSSLERIRYSKMFTENGEHIVNPENVMIADDPLDFDLPKP